MQRKRKVISQTEFKSIITYPRKEDFIGLIDKYIESVIIMPGDSCVTLQNVELTLPIYSLGEDGLIANSSGDPKEASKGEIIIWQKEKNANVANVIFQFEIPMMLLLFTGPDGQPNGGFTPGFNCKLTKYTSREDQAKKAARYARMQTGMAEFDEKLEMYASKEIEPLPELKYISDVHYKVLQYTKVSSMPKIHKDQFKPLNFPEGFFKKEGKQLVENTVTKTEAKNKMTPPRKEDFIELIDLFVQDVIKMPEDSHATIRNFELDKGEICIWQDAKSSEEPQVVIPFFIKKDEKEYAIKFDKSVKGSTKEDPEHQAARRDHMKAGFKAFNKKLALNSDYSAKPLPTIIFIKDVKYKTSVVEKLETQRASGP